MYVVPILGMNMLPPKRR